jgi:CBS domain-containing protein
MRIADILAGKRRTVHAVPPTATVADVVEELGRRRIGAVLVRDAPDPLQRWDPSGAIVGIVSERDVVRHLGTHGTGLLRLPVTEVMTRAVRTCSPDDDVATAMRLMTAGRYRHLPVVDRGRLVGMVSIGDLVKHRVREMELETAVLRDVVIARS